MTIMEARQETKMECREIEPDARHQWLRCQIGKTSVEPVQIPKENLTDDEKKIANGRPFYIHERIFHLKGFGSNWFAATEHFKATKGHKALAT